VNTQSKSTFDRFDTRVRSFLDKEFANDHASRHELLGLWETYLRLRLPNTDFVAEFTNGKKPSLAQRTWELLLASHLHERGHAITCPKIGPDFRFELNGTVVWVEAVCPEPKDIPAHILDPLFEGAAPFPHKEMLLRWTTAIYAKWDKLNSYLKKGIVAPNDAYVIAVNGRQLSSFPETRGISRMPFGVEAVFPVGPLAVKVDRETGRLGEAFISNRFHITNANNADIPTTFFVNPAHSGVSALIGCAQDRRHGSSLKLHVVHNPLAAVQLPIGSIGGSDDEWLATPVPGQADEFELQQANAPAPR
jgi:hypothetical protein